MVKLKLLFFFDYFQFLGCLLVSFMGKKILEDFISRERFHIDINGK